MLNLYISISYFSFYPLLPFLNSFLYSSIFLTSNLSLPLALSFFLSFFPVNWTQSLVFTFSVAPLGGQIKFYEAPGGCSDLPIYPPRPLHNQPATTVAGQRWGFKFVVRKLRRQKVWAWQDGRRTGSGFMGLVEVGSRIEKRGQHKITADPFHNV